VHITDALQRRRPVSVPDVTADTPYGRAFRARQSRRMGFVPTTVRSALYVPLVFQDRTLGLLAVTSQEANYYTQQRSDLAYAFANYAAAAIENSKVYSQSVRAAALEERSRLARELHDSVSQALFGIVLGTRTALHRIGEQPAEAEDPMKYVLSLAEAALAEMRALIFELRPESLQQQGLINAFRKQAEALCARHKIDVRVDLDAREPDLSLELKEALYRVALEAIQNTIKHAHATRVDLTLKQTQDSVHLEVIDNGLGFDPKQAYPGHYGLQTMQERIVRVGGQVNISSKLGEGTTVRVWVPAGAALPARPDGPLQLNAGQLQTL
jgi:signal transduction histidine kinase